MLKKTILIILTAITVTSCNKPTKFERDPAGIGYGVDDMKMSPCAVKNGCYVFYKNGKYKNEK